MGGSKILPPLNQLHMRHRQVLLIHVYFKLRLSPSPVFCKTPEWIRQTRVTTAIRA